MSGCRERRSGRVWAAASSAAFRATSLRFPCVGSATYHCRFQKRSLAAFRMRKRYAFGSTVIVGYAVPLTIGVSLNASMPTEMFGVPGISGGSQNWVGRIRWSHIVRSEVVVRVGDRPDTAGDAGGQNQGPYIQRPKALMPDGSPGFCAGM